MCEKKLKFNLYWKSGGQASIGPAGPTSNVSILGPAGHAQMHNGSYGTLTDTSRVLQVLIRINDMTEKKFKLNLYWKSGGKVMNLNKY